MEALTTLTDDALLVEESTMDPLSPLPSFVEMLLVQQAADSGRSALSAAVAALAASGDGGGTGSNSGVGRGSGVLRRMGLFLHRLLARMASRYGEEVCALLTYAVERRCLASESSGGSTAAETVYGLTRSRWSTKPPPPPPSRRETTSLLDDGGQGGVSDVVGRGVAAADGGAAAKREMKRAPFAKSVKGESSAGIARSGASDQHPEEAGGDSSSAGGYLAPLSDGDRVRSALVAALGPYVKEKLERAFERTRDNMNRERMLSTPSSRNTPPPDSVVFQNRLKRVAREAFVRSYPYVHLAWEGVAFAYQFAYLLGRTAHFTPSLHALGLIVRRVTMEDLQLRERRRPPRGTEKEVTTTAKKTSADSPPGASSTPTPSETTPRPSPTAASPHLVRRVRAAAVGGAAALLLVGWAVQVRAEVRRRRRRRIADSERRRRRQQQRDGVHHGGDDDDEGWSLPPPVPPAIPPSRAPPSAGGGGGTLVPLPPDPESCPLCLRCPRVNPAAAPSGYVFCYRCLVGHVRDAAARPSSSSSSSSSPSCPVTGVPCPEDRILRLFETHER